MKGEARGLRSIRSYVLRQGRFTDAQRSACERLLPRYGIPFVPEPLDFVRVYGRDAPTVLEIGFGMGETTAQIACTNPLTNYLGIEVHGPGVGSLLRLIEMHDLGNLRVIQHDAVDVLTEMIPTQSLAGIHIFFPDPWPKKRHHKRRLLQPGLARLMATRLVANGYLHVATDWQDYADSILDLLSAIPEFENTAQRFAPRPVYRPLTKFERRGLRLGHAVYDIVFRKIAAAGATQPR